MELSDIAKVEELSSYTETNDYFSLGWKLLGFYTTCYDTEGPAVSHQTPHYVLAWHGEEPKYPQRPKYTFPGVTEL